MAKSIILSLVLFAASLAWGQSSITGGGTIPTSVCNDSTHALGWTGAAYICNAITGSAAAGGSNTQVQWNNATALGGITQWTTNGTTTLTGSGTAILDVSALTLANLKLPATFFDVNGSGMTSVAGINYITSTANSVGLTATPTNSATNQLKFEITGSSYTGNAATATSSAALSISGQSGLLTFTGLASVNRAITVRDAADTMLELGGSYTPTGTWNWTSAIATWPTFNQSTSGNAGTATAAASAGTECSAGQAARGVDASWNAKDCFTPTGSGTVTTTGAMTATAILTSNSTGGTVVQTPNATATLSTGGNMSLPGTLAVTGHTTFEGVTSTGATGTGNLVYSASPTVTGTLSAAAINASGAISSGTAPTVCGTATGCFGFTEGTSANYAKVASQDAILADATDHAFYVTLNNGTKFLSLMNYSAVAPPALGATTPNTGAFTTLTGTTINTTTHCAAAGSAANPSLVACSAAASGLFSCATNASAGTCVISTTAVTATSVIQVQPDSSLGTALSVTCNTTADSGLTAPRVSARSAGTSFTITLGTFSTNPECFSYLIIG